MIRTLRTALSVALLSVCATAQNATVSVLHGIPNLPQPVEVFANGARLFSFDFGKLEGPLSVPAGVTNLEVRLNGAPILTASPDLQADTNYTVVAHLLENGGNTLTAFVNDVSRVEGLGKNFATVAFRHTADAPAVDVYATRIFSPEVFVFGNVANGQQGTIAQDPSAYLLGGPYDIRLTAAGSSASAFGPAAVGDLTTGDYHSVFAIGELGQPSFQLVVQTIETAAPPLPTLQSTVLGTSCGGQISLSTTTLQFDQAFDVVLTGGTPNAEAFLLIGYSDSGFLGTLLPFDLTLFGAPGCSIFVEPAGAASVTLDAAGSGRVTETIPAAVARFISNYGVYAQWGYDAGNANALNLLFSDYVAITTL